MINLEEFYTLSPGDQVKIVDKWPKTHDYRGNPISEWLGKVMTVRVPAEYGGNLSYHMEEDFSENGGEGYFWYPDMIDHVVSSIEPLPLQDIMGLYGGDTE